MLYIFPVIIFVTVFNIPRLYELETCLTLNSTRVTNVTTQCEKVTQLEGSESACKISICTTELRNNFNYCRDYILIANFVMMVFIPLVILSVVNCHLYRFITISGKSINKTSSRQKRDQRIARILIIIVMVFTCCNVPRAIINLYEVSKTRSNIGSFSKLAPFSLSPKSPLHFRFHILPWRGTLKFRGRFGKHKQFLGPKTPLQIP